MGRKRTVATPEQLAERAARRLAFSKEWAAANRDKVNETQKKWRETNPDRVEKLRQSYLAKNKERYATDEVYRARVLARNARYRAGNDTHKTRKRRARENASAFPDTWVRTILPTCRTRAFKKDVPFDLTVEDIDVPTHCPVFGVELIFGMGKNVDAGPSLDRLRPELGYVRGNVRVICYAANRAKSNLSLAQHRQLVAWMEREMEPHRLHSEGIIF